jgi:hypothetical protein
MVWKNAWKILYYVLWCALVGVPAMLVLEFETGVYWLFFAPMMFFVGQAVKTCWEILFYDCNFWSKGLVFALASFSTVGLLHVGIAFAEELVVPWPIAAGVHASLFGGACILTFRKFQEVFFLYLRVVKKVGRKKPG